MSDHRKQVHRTAFHTKIRQFLVKLMQKNKLKLNEMVFDGLCFDERAFECFSMKRPPAFKPNRFGYNTLSKPIFLILISHR